MNACLKTFAALVLMIALSFFSAGTPQISDTLAPVQVQNELVGQPQHIQTAVWVKRHLRWLARRHPRLLLKQLWACDHLLRELLFLAVLVALAPAMSPYGVLLASVPRTPYWDQLAPTEKSDWTRRSNKLAKEQAAYKAACREYSKAVNATYQAPVVEPQGQSVRTGEVDGRPAPKCLAYVSHYYDDNGQLAEEKILTRKLRNQTRDGNVMAGKLFHYAAGVREFVESRVPDNYIVVSTEDVAHAMYIIHHGLLFDDGNGPTIWHVALGTVRDSGTTFIMIRKRVDMVQFLRTIGVSIRITSRAQGNSAAKYLKRLMAFHEYMWEGKTLGVKEVRLTNVLSQDGSKVQDMVAWEVRVQYPFLNHESTYLIRPDDPATDGCSHLSIKHVNELLAEFGRHERKGYTAAITAHTPVGLIKGHALAVGKELSSCQQYDGILIGNKKIVAACDDRWVFGILQSKHGAEEVFTDVQSVIHFMLEKFLFSWGVEDMEQVARFVENGKGVRMPTTTTFGKIQKLAEKVPGFNLALIPKLVTSLYRLRHHRVTRMNEITIRIPGGMRRYVIADPRILRRDGSTDIRLAKLTGDQVHCSGLEQRIAGHRQPNGHCQEHFLANAVNDPELAWLGSHSVVIVFAPEHAITMLSRMGGGDQDDSVIVYTQPEHVTHFANLPAYPGSHQPRAKAPVRSESVAYNHKLLAYLCEQKSEQQGIGYFVNKLMVFNYWWSVRDQFPEIYGKLVEMFSLGWGLEEVVDSVVKTGASLVHWDAVIRNFADKCTHVPIFLTRRMQKQVDATTCKPEKTPMDVVLQNIRKEGERLLKATTRYASGIVASKWNDWDLARRVAYAVTIVTPTGRALADSARKTYTTTLREAKKQDPEGNHAAELAEAAFIAKLRGNPHANEALAILFHDLHLQFGKDGLPPTGCLWGFNSCELTMAMLEAVSHLNVPETFTYTWKPPLRPIWVVNNMRAVRESNPTAFLEWKLAAGRQVTIKPQLSDSNDGYGNAMPGHKLDPFTGTPWVEGADVLLNGQKYGCIATEQLNAFVHYVRGQKRPTGTLIDPDTNCESMVLYLPGLPLPAPKRRGRNPMEEPAAWFSQEEEFRNFMESPDF